MAVTQLNLRGQSLLQLSRLTRRMYATGLWRAGTIAALFRYPYRILNPESAVCVPVRGNTMIVDTRDANIAPSLILTGIYEEQQTKLLEQVLKPGMVMVDIGANIGYYTLLGAKLVGGNGIVYSFEPEPRSYNALRRNIENNGYKNVVLANRALSNRRGTERLFVDRFNLGGSSFTRIGLGDIASVLTVETARLDDYFGKSEHRPRVDLIKLDAQGAEGLIVEGASETLRPDHVKLLLEFCPSALVSLGSDPCELLRTLGGHGFRVHLVDDRLPGPSPLSSDDTEAMCNQKDNRSYSANLYLEKK